MTLVRSRKPKLRWSDVWLLLSIYATSRERAAELSEIIGAADYINHAILTHEELASGLNRLLDHGLIREGKKPLTFLCTGEITARIKRRLSGSVGYLAVSESLQNDLDATPYEPGEALPHPSNNLTFPGLGPEETAAAVERNHASWKRMMSRSARFRSKKS